MDGQMIGLVGGIGGSVVGVLGGVLGTYVDIRNAKGPHERAFKIRAAAWCWLGVSTFLACLFLMPMPWRPLLWLVYGPALYSFIRWSNERQALAKLEDRTEAE